MRRILLGIRVADLPLEIDAGLHAVNGSGDLSELLVGRAQIPGGVRLSSPVSDLAGDFEPLLVELDRLPGLAEVGVGGAQVAEGVAFASPVAQLSAYGEIPGRAGRSLAGPRRGRRRRCPDCRGRCLRRADLRSRGRWPGTVRSIRSPGEFHRERRRRSPGRRGARLRAFDLPVFSLRRDRPPPKRSAREGTGATSGDERRHGGIGWRLGRRPWRLRLVPRPRLGRRGCGPSPDRRE